MEFDMSEKIYYSKENLTPDKDCALLPANVLHGDITKTKHYHKDYRGFQSGPCIVCTPKGKLLCIYTGDNSDAPEESPNNYILISISNDNGETWNEAEWIIDHPLSVRMHEATLWLSPDGTLWTFWSQSYNWWDGRAGVWEIHCENPDDDELIWTEPKRLCDGVMATPPIATETGEWFFPVSIWKHYPSEYNKLPELESSNVYVSRDKAKTLEYVGNAYEPDTTFDENAIVEREDGSLFMIMRTSDAIASCESFDRGKTWTTPIKMMDSPSSRSYLAKFPSGNLLLIAHDDFMGEKLDDNAEPIPGTHVPCRNNMTAFLSEDGGKTWPYSLRLDNRNGISYPCGMITPEGRAYVAYDWGRYHQREILYASFLEEEIRNGKLSNEKSVKEKVVVAAGKLRKGHDKLFETGEEMTY